MLKKVIFLGTVELPLKPEVVQAPEKFTNILTELCLRFFHHFSKEGPEKTRIFTANNDFI